MSVTVTKVGLIASAALVGAIVAWIKGVIDGRQKEKDQYARSIAQAAITKVRDDAKKGDDGAVLEDFNKARGKDR